MTNVWDIWVRLFHWSLALSVTVNLFSGKTGVLFHQWHKFLGEIVLALVVFRIVWGLAGSSTARLRPLFCHPLKAFHDLQSLVRRQQPIDEYRHNEYGHSAAGGYAVLALLLLCGIQAATGLFIADHDGRFEGRFYHSVGHGVSHFIHDIHHTVGSLLLCLVLVHIIVIFVYFFYAKTNLIKPMITGLKRTASDRTSADGPSSDGPSSDGPSSDGASSDGASTVTIKPWWVGLLLAGATAVMYFVLFQL